MTFDVKLSTELLLTSPAGFGITTASPAQRAICRIIDGRMLRELATDPDVIALVGGAGAVADLPSEHGRVATENAIIAAIRTAKTIIALAAGIRATQTVNVDGLTHGEIPRVTILSLKLDLSDAAFGILRAATQASPVLRRLLVGEPGANSLMLRHPSGRPIEIACVAGAKAGGGLVARWSAGLIADEAPRMCGNEDGVVNLDDARAAVLGRLLPGAQVLYIGSPWAPFGPVYDMVQEHWTVPNERTVVLRGTGPMLNPHWWTAARCEDLRKRNPIAYRCDVLGEFADHESGQYPSELLDRSTRADPLELAPHPDYFYSAGSDLGTRRNASTLIITTCVSSIEGVKKYAVACARQWVPRPDAPLSPDAIFRDMADICRRYRITTIHADKWGSDFAIESARRVGLRLVQTALSQTDTVNMYDSLRLRMEGGEFELPPHPKLREDLLHVRKRVTQTGLSIVLPKTSDGRHCDFAPALCLSMLKPPLPPQSEYQRRQREKKREADAWALANALGGGDWPY